MKSHLVQITKFITILALPVLLATGLGHITPATAQSNWQYDFNSGIPEEFSVSHH